MNRVFTASFKRSVPCSRTTRLVVMEDQPSQWTAWLVGRLETEKRIAGNDCKWHVESRRSNEFSESGLSIRDASRHPPMGNDSFHNVVIWPIPEQGILDCVMYLKDLRPKQSRLLHVAVGVHSMSEKLVLQELGVRAFIDDAWAWPQIRSFVIRCHQLLKTAEKVMSYE